jgi:hypothetical protein
MAIMKDYRLDYMAMGLLLGTTVGILGENVWGFKCIVA